MRLDKNFIIGVVQTLSQITVHVSVTTLYNSQLLKVTSSTILWYFSEGQDISERQGENICKQPISDCWPEVLPNKGNLDGLYSQLDSF